MTKEQFNQLDVLDQIKYVNNQLEDNSTLTVVCKGLNIGRSTIRDRFKKNGYIYSKDLNRYVYYDSKTDIVQFDKVTTDIINKSDVEIREIIIDIVNSYDILKEIINLHMCNTSVIKKQIVIDVEYAKSKVTTLRVNSKELELFNIFCNDNKQYKKIDLISQALKEFREKYS